MDSINYAFAPGMSSTTLWWLWRARPDISQLY